MPILYFGNRAEYEASPIRIVTVGLNPSYEEFPSGQPFKRFSRMLHGDRTQYLQALDEYFGPETYSWFRSFQAVLEGLDAGFDSRQKNKVIHTDLCSPIPTKPTWSKLPKAISRDLISDGFELWQELMAVLKPHVVITVVRDEYVKKMGLPTTKQWKELYRCDCHQPTVETIERGSVLYVHGPCANRPFLTFCHDDKLAIGRRLARLVGD